MTSAFRNSWTPHNHHIGGGMNGGKDDKRLIDQWVGVQRCSWESAMSFDNVAKAERMVLIAWRELQLAEEQLALARWEASLKPVSRTSRQSPGGS